jgi:hypothetical protein
MSAKRKLDALSRKIAMLDAVASECSRNQHFDMADIWRSQRDILQTKYRLMLRATYGTLPI